MKASIVLLPGDGVGPEVIAEGRKVLEATAAAFGHDFFFSEHLIGGTSIDTHGTALTDEALDACRVG
jgi:3-isopropylmalate dehydrogenase